MNVPLFISKHRKVILSKYEAEDDILHILSTPNDALSFLKGTKAIFQCLDYYRAATITEK